MKKTIKVITLNGNLKGSNTIHTDSLTFEVARAMAALQQRTDAPSCLSTAMIVYELLSNFKYQQYNTRVSNAKRSGHTKIERRMVHGSMFRLSRVGLLDTYKSNTYKINLEHKVEVAGKVMSFKEYVASLDGNGIASNTYPRQAEFSEMTNPTATPERLQKIISPLLNNDETYMVSHVYDVMTKSVTICLKLKEKK